MKLVTVGTRTPRQHVHLPHQCVGAAVYRANVCKRPRDQELLTASPDRRAVFATPAEFLAHHVDGVGKR